MRRKGPDLQGQSISSAASALGTWADSGYELLLPYLPGTPNSPQPMPFRPGEPAQFMRLRGSTAPGRGMPPATVPVPWAQEPSAGEYGLLDPHIADEPVPPREGLLSPVDLPPGDPEGAAGLATAATTPVPPFELSDAKRQGMIDRLLQREGGYVNDPDDRGGPTNYGITQIAIDDYNRLMQLENGPTLDKPPAAISRAEAEAIHQKMLNAYRFDRLSNDALREQIFDMATNHGPGQAVLLLQEVLSRNGYPVAIDGVLGPQTRAVLNEVGVDPDTRRQVNNDLVSRRLDFYRQIIQSDPSQKDFEKGWLERARSFQFLPPPVYRDPTCLEWRGPSWRRPHLDSGYNQR